MVDGGSAGRLIFVNAPTLAAAGNRNDSRQIRSELMRRQILEKREHQQRSQGSGLGPKQAFLCRCSDRSGPVRGQANRKAKSDAVPGAGLENGDAAEAPHHTLEAGKGIFCASCGSYVIRQRGRKRTPRVASPTTTVHRVPAGSSKFGPLAGCADYLNKPGDLELLDHFAKRLALTFRTSDEWVRGCYSSFIFCQPGPLLSHSILLASSAHLEWAARSHGAIEYPSRLLERLRHRGEALRLLREALSQPVLDKSVLDDALMCILLLAIYDNRQGSMTREPSPFNSRMSALQGLDICDAGSYHPTHWNIMQRLIAQNGGIHKIKLYALPWFLSFSSLKHAVATHSKPVFPIVNPLGKPFADDSPLKMLNMTRELPSDLGNSGFHQLEMFQIKKTVVRPFLDLTELAEAMDAMEKEQQDLEVNYRFGDARNLVQYRLLSLPEPDEPSELILEQSAEMSQPLGYVLDVYYACRFAAILFTTHVTFPVLRSRHIRDRLVPALQHAICKSENPTDAAHVSGLLLWCTTIGGIAAQDEQPIRRRWYVDQFTRLCSVLSIDTWESLKEHLRSFAWVDDACDAAGYSLWVEANYPVKNN